MNIRKISILVVFLVFVIIALNTVDAVDNETNLTCDVSCDDVLEIAVSESSISDENFNDLCVDDYLKSSDLENGKIGSNDSSKGSVVHTITEETYSNYFDSNGNLNNSLVSINDTINLSGNFTKKSFVFNIALNVTSTNKDAYLYNCHVAFVGVNNTDSDYVCEISNLNMKTTVNEKLVIEINSSSDVRIVNNVIYSTGSNSYPISLVDNAVNCVVANNTIKTAVPRVSSGNENESNDNSSWQHSAITLLDAYYNEILDNNITVEDSYGIYLCYGHSTSDYNIIRNNTIKCSVDNPTFWAYGIYLMGSYNEVLNNTISGMYRGVSAANGYNIIAGNKIYNITGVDLLYSDIIGGDYAIYGSNNAIIANNSIYNAEVSKAGIIVGVNSDVYGNYIEIVTNNTGIKIGGEEGGSNSKIYNNTINFLSGYGILIDGYPNNVSVLNNSINSLSSIGAAKASGEGVGIGAKYQSSRKRPSNITIEDNKIFTSNDYAINISQVSYDSYICKDNKIYGKNILYPEHIESSEIIKDGEVYTVTEKNYNEFFSSDGKLSSKVKSGDTLIFKGNFTPKGKIILSKSVNIIGDNAILKNTTICVNTHGCTVSNLTIINNGTDNCNLWGIYVYESDNITITNNNISIWDKNTSYGIYLCDSIGSNVSNNTIRCQGDELVFALLNYEVYNSTFENNDILAIGTGELYPYIETICFDGVHSISELSKTYGVIFDYSSNNTFLHNNINVTSTVEGFQVPYQPSVNILIGLYVYYDSNNNNISENNVYVSGRDPFLYGIGCSGDDTSKSSTTADNNTFKNNNITLDGDYFTMGLILRHNSLNTSVDNNTFNLTSNNYTYGITLEISGFSNVTNNKIYTNAFGNYGVELYSSWANNIESNTVYASGSYTDGIGLYSSSGNSISYNSIVNRGDEINDPAQGPEHPDVVDLANVGILISQDSNYNTLTNNDIESDHSSSISITSGSTNNIIQNNTLSANGTSGDASISDSVGGNSISNNTGTAKSYSYSGKQSSSSQSNSTKYSNNTSNSNSNSDSNSNQSSNANTNSTISGTSSQNGASNFGSTNTNFQSNAKSSAEAGSGDTSPSDSSSPSVKEILPASTKALSSPFAVPLILSLLLAIFFYSFLASRDDDDEEDLS